METLAYNSEKKKKKDVKDASLVSLWTDEGECLFRLLSAGDDWNAKRLPKLNSFAKNLTKDRKLTRAQRLIRATARNWEGTLLESGLTSFLSVGFLAENLAEEPGGFTVFMCCPLEYQETRAKVFGGEGKLTDAAIREFSDTKFFIPTCRSDCEYQLRVAVRVLDLLTGPNSMAAAGYRRGLQILLTEGRRLKTALDTDSTFLVRFLYLLDCAFQQFCEKLLLHSKKPNPIRSAFNRRLHLFQCDFIDTELRSFLSIGAVPPLALPSILTRPNNKTGGIVGVDKKKGRNSGKGKEKDDDEREDEKARKKKAAADKGDDPDWFVDNPGVVWKLPEGKAFPDIFGSNNRPNQQGFPKVDHHVSQRPKIVCLKYQVVGYCNQGRRCSMSHAVPSKMSAKIRGEMEARFAEVYKDA